DIDRQLALNDLDIAQNRFLGIGRKAEDIARIGNGAVVAPFLQHHAVVGDLVLTLLGGEQVVRVDVLKADEHAADAGTGRLLDEGWKLVTERIHVDGETDILLLALAKCDQAIEQRLTLVVSSEVAVGDEEAPDALRVVL